MEKVLITGGSGFFGFHLASELSKNYMVDIIDNFSRGKFDYEFKRLIKNRRVKLIKFDFNDNFH